MWTDYKITSPENQKIIWLPFNDKTQTIFYDQRIVISEPREEPVVWKTTKIEDMYIRGIDRITFAQVRWNAHTDYIEKDMDGNIIGMWADYYSDGVTPTESDDTYVPETYGKITYSGTAPQIKIGGSYKKFTVTFFDQNGETGHKNGKWGFTIDDADVSELVSVLTSDVSKDVSENQIKVRFTGDDSFIGKSMMVQYLSDDGILAKTEIGIAGL